MGETAAQMLRFFLGCVSVASTAVLVMASTVTVVPADREKVKWLMLASAVSMFLSALWWFAGRKSAAER